MSRLPSVRLSRALTISSFAALVSAPAVRAQASAVLDEGTLMVSRNGTPIGRESYRIVRAPGPGGQVYQARSSTALGTDRVSAILGTDSTGVPVTYEAEVTSASSVTDRLSGRGRPGRFSVLVQTRTGESAREYRLNNGALLIDQDVFHQYFFLGLAGSHTRFNVISPRSQQEAMFQFEERGRETLDIGGRKIDSRHLALVGASGSRDVWLDARGRLLKVAIAADGLVALRDDAPRN